MLKEDMKSSSGWNAAHNAGYQDMLPGVAFVPNIMWQVVNELWDTSGLDTIFGIPDLKAFISGVPILNLMVPGLDASKIISGQFVQDMIEGLGETFDGMWNWVENTVTTVSGTIQNVIDTVWQSMFGGASTGHFIEDVFTALTSIPGGNIISSILASIVPGLDASKIISGLFPQSQVSNLVSDLLAKLNINIFKGSATAGSNLVISPNFEDSSIVRWSYDNPCAYSTDFAHSGTQSYRMQRQVGQSETWVWLLPTAPATDPGRNPSDLTQGIKVQPGQKFYMEAWVYAPAGTTAGTDVAIAAGFLDATGANGPLWPAAQSVTSPATGTWTKLSGYVTVPANRNIMVPYFTTFRTGGDSNVFYVDDVIVREETAPQDIITQLWGAVGATITGAIQSLKIPGLDASKIISGLFPQSQVTDLSENLSRLFSGKSAGPNLIPDPSFENATLDAIRFTGQGGGFTHDTAQKYRGTRSLKHVYSGSGYPGMTLTPTLNRNDHIPVKPGQKFYLSQWVYDDPANTGSGLVQLFMECTDSTGTNPTTWPAVDTVGAYNLTSSVWTKQQGYITIPAGYDRAKPLFCCVRPGNNANDTFWFDWVECYEVTEAQNIVAQLWGSVGATLGQILNTVVPGLDATKIITGIFGTSQIPALPASQITSGTFGSGQIPGLDASKVISGILGIGQIPTNQIGRTNVSDLGSIIDNITKVFSGLSGSGYDTSNANTALNSAQTTIDQTAADVQAMKTQQGGANNSGRSFVNNFSGVADGATLASQGLTLTNVSGSGGDPVFSGGRLYLHGYDPSTRELRIIDTTDQTDGDYQLIGVTFNTGPGVNAWARIYGRSDATGNNSIELEFDGDGWGNWFFKLGRRVGGVFTEFVPRTQITNWGGSTLWLECGTAGGARVFRVTAGNTVQATYTEAGTASLMGAGYRYHGVGSFRYFDGFTVPASAQVLQTSLSDNQPPTTVGSFARVYRSSTTSTASNGGTGNREVPTNTFDVTDRKTSDWTLVNGKSLQLSATTGKAGAYIVKFGIRNSAAQINGTILEPLLYVTPNGGSSAIKERGHWQYVNQGAPYRFSETFIVYLNPGDMITPGSNAPSFSMTFAGEATGSETYMTVAMANVSTN